VTSILPFVRKTSVVFDDGVTRIIGEAFDEACKELHDIGQPAIIYDVVAKRIIEAAKYGERDPVRLRNSGLAVLGLNDKEASPAGTSIALVQAGLSHPPGARPGPGAP